MACALYLPKEKGSLLLFAEGEGVVQRGCTWRGCPAEEGHDAERVQHRENTAWWGCRRGTDAVCLPCLQV